MTWYSSELPSVLGYSDSLPFSGKSCKTWARLEDRSWLKVNIFFLGVGWVVRSRGIRCSFGEFIRRRSFIRRGRPKFWWKIRRAEFDINRLMVISIIPISLAIRPVLNSEILFSRSSNSGNSIAIHSSVRAFRAIIPISEKPKSKIRWSVLPFSKKIHSVKDYKTYHSMVNLVFMAWHLSIPHVASFS